MKIYCLLTLLFSIACSSPDFEVKGNRVYEVDHKAVRLKNGAAFPTEPLLACAAQVQGEARVEVVLAPDGKVYSAVPLSGPQSLRAASATFWQNQEFYPVLTKGAPHYARFIGIIAVKLSEEKPHQPIVTKSIEAPFIEALRTKAAQGDANSQYELGVCYISGNGIYGQPTEAVKWLRKAADQGHALAQFRLGVRYSNGQGVPRDQSEAIRWFRKSAEQNVMEAQYYLGMHLPPANRIEIYKWYQMAANQGHMEAQYYLGLAFESGNMVVPQDLFESAKWYKKAADQGHCDAQYQLGLCYEQGKGVARNDSEAVKWLGLASKRGDRRAQRNLGLRYSEGIGVPKNEVEAYAWLMLSRPFELCGTSPDSVDVTLQNFVNKLSAQTIEQGMERIAAIEKGFEPWLRHPATPNPNIERY